MAAAARGEQVADYCRALLSRDAPSVVVAAAAGPDWQKVALKVTDGRHEHLRVLAARLDVPLNSVCVAIFEVHTPMALDVLLDEILKEP